MVARFSFLPLAIVGIPISTDTTGRLLMEFTVRGLRTTSFSVAMTLIGTKSDATAVAVFVLS